MDKVTSLLLIGWEPRVFHRKGRNCTSCRVLAASPTREASGELGGAVGAVPALRLPGPGWPDGLQFL